MSLASWTDLQTALNNWLDHTIFSARYSEFVSLFESYANRTLRVRNMEISANMSPVSGSATLPADYIAWRRVTWTGSPRAELSYVHPSYYQSAFPARPTGTPSIFTIEGSTMKIMPLDTTAIELDYYQAIPGLVANSTNWLMTAHPDLYLFGSLVESEAFGVNDDRMPMWKARRDDVFQQIVDVDNANKLQRKFSDSDSRAIVPRTGLRMDRGGGPADTQSYVPPATGRPAS